MKAPAKINVCLFLGPPRRADGRHELVSVMQSVDLSDELRLEPGRGSHDEVVCPQVPGQNLALDAVTAFRARTGWDGPPVRIRIDKRIPVAAGMAGGSADAAATLRLLAEHTGMEPDDTLLFEIATELGADVPAQVAPSRHLATGAGERLEPLPPVSCYGVLVLPGGTPLATADVYREADRLGLPRPLAALRERAAAVRAALPALPTELVVNDLQPAAVSLCPPIEEALGDARDAGAQIALVSGSGPTVLGLFGSLDGARAAAEALSARRPAHAVGTLGAA